MPGLLTWDANKQAQYQQMHSQQFLTLHFVLDQSFSMLAYKTNVLEGYNRYLTHLQRLAPPLCFWELTLFHETATRYPAVALAEAESLTTRSYAPFGGTALFDALGIILTQHHQQSRHLLIIMTDGEDNMSQTWTADRCAEILKSYQALEQWTCVYLAAYADGLKVGRALGIPDGNCKLFPGDDLPAVFADLAQRTTAFLAARDPVRGYLPSTSFFGKE